MQDKRNITDSKEERREFHAQASELQEDKMLKIRLSRKWTFCPQVPEGEWMDKAVNGIPFELKNGAADLDILAGRSPEVGAEAVLYQEFESDEEGIAQLGFGCDWWCEVFCNGVFCCSTFSEGNGSNTFSPENNPFFLPVRKGWNLLALRVRRGSHSWMFAFGPVEFCLPDLPVIQHGPWLGNPDAESMSIRFVTAGNIGAGVEYRKHGEKSWRLLWDHVHGQIRRSRFHVLHLSGLECGTSYDYRIVLIDPQTPEKRVRPDGDGWYTFRIPEADCGKFSFFYTADLQFPLERQTAVLDSLLQAAGGGSSDFFVFGGDIGSSFESAALFRGAIARICASGGAERPLVTVRGNHELRGEEADRYLDYFGDRNGLSYGVFRFGDTAFLILDCWEDKPAESEGAGYCKYNLDDLFLQEEKEFLARALASEKWTSAKRRIVLSHGAPYSHFDSCMTMPFVLQEMTDPYFAGKKPVSRLNLWLAGHTHRYSRSIPGTAVIAAPVPPETPHKDGRDYCYPVFTVAGPDAAQPIQASAFRIDAEPGKLVVSAFSPDGACFEKIELADDGAITERISLPHFEVPADERMVNDPKN